MAAVWYVQGATKQTMDLKGKTWSLVDIDKDKSY
jgi:hypothetical protein